MNVSFFFWIILSYSTNILANQDSLWAIWHNEEIVPIERLAVLQALNIKYLYEAPDSCWEVIELQNQYATAQRNDFWIAKSLDNKAEWYSLADQIDSAILYSHRAITLFEQIWKQE